YYQPTRYNAGDPGDPNGAAETTIEAWVQSQGSLPGSTQFIASGPTSGGTVKWQLSVQSDGQLNFFARNSVPTGFTVVGGSLPANAGWSHVVGTVQGGNVRLYVNGAQVASTAWSGNFSTTIDVGASFFIGGIATTALFGVDEVAWYDYGLTASR